MAAAPKGKTTFQGLADCDAFFLRRGRFGLRQPYREHTAILGCTDARLVDVARQREAARERSVEFLYSPHGLAVITDFLTPLTGQGDHAVGDRDIDVLAFDFSQVCCSCCQQPRGLVSAICAGRAAETTYIQARRACPTWPDHNVWGSVIITTAIFPQRYAHGRDALQLLRARGAA